MRISRHDKEVIPMSHVTQGTVQVERNTKDAVKTFINPTTDYAVKHNEKDYIVLVNAESPSKSRLFERKKNGFTIEGFTATELYFIEMLTDAAFKGTKIEIMMNADCTKIEALKIPAMP
jgi:hypothetical protein